MASTAERAARWGIEIEYFDAFGQRQSVTPEALETLLAAVEAASPPATDSMLPASVVIRGGNAAPLDLPQLPADQPVEWEITAGEQSIARGTATAGDCWIPGDLPLGTYTLTLSSAGQSGPMRHATPLLIAPGQTYQGADQNSRTWALAVQLYGVRSHRNWGHGDFTDLTALIDLAADLGAGGIGLNPLHALFDDRPEQASPYAPNSRLFLNILYIDVEAVPEFPGIEASGLGDDIKALRESERVDYTGVARAKLRALQLAYEIFRAAAPPERRSDFDAFRNEQGDALTRFASFEMLRRRFPQVWWEWPESWRRPSDDALADLRFSNEKAIGFYEFMQWIADRQLAACQDRADARGLPIGLYLDIAVGVDAGGADAWSAQDAILRTLSAGAPPDAFNPRGQNWGIAAFHPGGLIGDHFMTFRRTLAAAMRHAGAIRIDHVLGLNRLFLIPHGASPADGGYFRFPLQALLAVVAQESVANRCIVIGEDLGTVPPELRAQLADWGLWTYRVLMFERADDGGFFAPEHYPAMALATFTTHDLPTFTGWSNGHDLAVRRALGLKESESDEERRQTRDRLRATAAHAGFDADNFAGIAGFLAKTPCRLVVVSIEDLLGIKDQPNLPGTIDEHPNWRQRLPVALEDWSRQDGVRAVAEVFTHSGRSAVPQSG